jgi:2-amino-4-hydroxy-6-hydroxymethyldihydropteridine diphosphokinase
MSNLAYIGVGSNIASPLENCQKSIALLAQRPEIKFISHSAFYETEPVGPQDQGWFVNAVVKVTTELPPLLLLDALLAIENEMGRIRKIKWGPRKIDLDILLYGTRAYKHDRLEIPHPEMIQRRFVLAPLAELTPDLLHPTANKTIEQLLSELHEDKKVVRL